MFVILALVAVTSKVQANAVLRGVVLLNEEGGPPMGNVEMSAVGRNPTNTGADGQFTFRFPNKNPGDTVSLTLRKEGYVVVNDIQREVTLPANPDCARLESVCAERHRGFESPPSASSVLL